MARSSRTLALGFGALVLIALVIAVTGRFDQDPEDTTTTTTSTATTTTSTTTTSTTTTTTTLSPLEKATERVNVLADALVNSMNDEQLAYQLIATGLTGTDVRGRLDDVVGSACVGAVFMTETNNNWAPVDDPDAARDAISTVRRRDFACALAPLIATDAEFGSVVRVPVDSPPAASDWGSRYEISAPADVIVAIGTEANAYALALADLGIDLNFGVVGDVDLDPGYFMARSGRTFGDDQATTAALSGAVLSAHCQAGVAPTLKHFPNQGSTVEDPHDEPSTAVGGAERFRADAADPWRNTPAPVVMTGHILVPDIDPELPASMSRDVTTGLLRDELGFDGVVVTDDLSTMRGASDIVPTVGARAVNAIHAGADLALFVDDRDVASAVEALTLQMEVDAVFRDRAIEAVTRTVRLRLELAEPDVFPICR